MTSMLADHLFHSVTDSGLWCESCCTALSPVTIDRDVNTEAKWTLEAGVSAGVLTASLTAMAAFRAGPAAVRAQLIRRFDRETLEELADARNYLVWWKQQMTLIGDHSMTAKQIVDEIDECLVHVAKAFEHARRASELRRAWRRERGR